MSSRQLRKLQKQKELQQPPELSKPESEEDESDDGKPEPAPAKPRMSLFAALGGEEEEDNGDDEREETKPDTTHKNGATTKQESEAESETVPQPAKKSKKKKKKTKRKEAAPQAEDELVEVLGDQDDEIERALRELDVTSESKSGSKPGAASGDLAKRSRDVDGLLAVNAYHLKAIHEMRNLFGKEAIDAAEQEEQAEQAAERRRQGRQGPRTINLEQALKGDPRHKLPEISLRRNIFIQGRDDWPRATAAGLTMREVRRGHSDGDLTEFTFHHDAEYDKTQVLFFHMVQMGEPMHMVSLLREKPYHVTTLLQVSKMASQDQNPALAAELCERALFTFGRVTTAAFRQKLERGKARLDFRRPENREFWLAGYHYLKSLVRKGTYRTALEWAKLLFALNPNDPYAMKNFLHPLAIRTRQARWLVDFCAAPEFMAMSGGGYGGGGGYDDDGPFDAHDRQQPGDEYTLQTLVLAHLQLGDDDRARDLAVRGMESIPWLYGALFKELSIDPIPPPLWGVKPPGDESQHWTNVYLYQAKDLWDNAPAVSTLKEAVKRATTADPGSYVADPPSDLRTARFAFLEGDTKLIAGVPRQILSQQPNYEFDPLPPPLGENVFSSGEGVRLPWATETGGRGGGLLETAQGRAFFERMRRQMERAQQRGGAGVGGAGIGAFGGGDDDEGDPFDVIPDDDDDDDLDDLDDLDERERLWREETHRDEVANMEWPDQDGDPGWGWDGNPDQAADRMPGGGDDELWADGGGGARDVAGQGGIQRMVAGFFGGWFGSRQAEAEGGAGDGGLEPAEREEHGDGDAERGEGEGEGDERRRDAGTGGG